MSSTTGPERGRRFIVSLADPAERKRVAAALSPVARRYSGFPDQKLQVNFATVSQRKGAGSPPAPSQARVGSAAATTP